MSHVTREGQRIAGREGEGFSRCGHDERAGVHVQEFQCALRVRLARMLLAGRERPFPQFDDIGRLRAGDEPICADTSGLDTA